MKFKKKLLESKLWLGSLISFLLFLFLTLLFLLGVGERQQLSLGNYLYTPGVASPEIIIIEIDDKSIQEIGRWPWDRLIFAQLLEKLHPAKVIGIDVSFLEKTSSDASLQSALSEKVVLSLEYNKISGQEKFSGQGLLKPVLSAEYGLVNLFADADGIIRSFPRQVSDGETYSNLGLKVAEIYAGKKFPLKGKELINFFQGFKKLSFVDVLKGRTNIYWENKIVLIGATAPDLHDDHLVPILKGKRMPGVEIQANIVQMVLTGRFLREPGLWEVIFTLFLLSVLLVLILGKLKLRYSWLVCLLLLISYLYLAALFFRKGLILNLVYPFLTLLLNYGFILGGYYLQEHRHKKWLIEVLGKYVSEEVAKEILKKGYDEKLLARGKRREITILFADIRGFTSLSEKLSPEKVVDLLNLYLGEITKIIFKHGGTIDKYIGDAVMAVWNAPLEQKDHLLLAIKAGLEMQEAIKKISGRRKLKVGYGIGINSGPAVVGNIGSEKRLEYTAIGDAVNLASRMCSLAQAGEVVIPKGVYEKIKEKIIVEDLGKFKVKGKEKEIRVYKVIKIL